MNILLSSYSVNPYHGSEDGIGWNWTLQLSKNFPNSTIYLLTKRFNESATRKGIIEFGLKNVKLIIVDVPDYLNWFREKHSMFHHMYYYLWQRAAYRWAKNSKIKFDIIHHVTMGDFRFTGKMYKFKDAYTIYGPVGGGQSTPSSLKCYEKNIYVEKFREIINKTRGISPFYRNRINKFNAVYCINKETADIVSKAIKRKCSTLMELAVAEDFKNLNNIKPVNTAAKIVFVGRLIEKKGLMLLIDVIDKIDKTLDFELIIYGNGPLATEMEAAIKEKKLNDKIKIAGAVEHSKIISAYKDADIFVMPSLRETSGNVLIEALACKTPVVALEASICITLKEKNCGIFINTNQDKNDIIKEYALAIEKLIHSPELRTELGESGYNFVNKELTWDKKFKTVYKEFLN